MRALLQRVTHASVVVEGETLGAIGRGYLILLGIHGDDRHVEIDKLARKVVGLRIFPNEQGKFDKSLMDVGGSALVVSQFTLFGNVRKGRRPDFTSAARPDFASLMCDAFVTALSELGVSDVQTGRFGADMQVTLCNDGPVTLWLDTHDW